MWSSGMAAGGFGRNSGEGLAGEGRGCVEDGRGLTTGRFGVEVGAEGRPAAGSAAPSRAGRGRDCSGEVGRKPVTGGGQWATLGTKRCGGSLC
jgi:hypothetical protein